MIRHLDENDATDIRPSSNLCLVLVTKHWEVTKLPSKGRCDERCTTKPFLLLILAFGRYFSVLELPATLKVCTTFYTFVAV